MPPVISFSFITGISNRRDIRMPLSPRRPSPLPAVAAFLIAALIVGQTGPVRAADGLLDTMVQAAKDAPARLHEGNGKSYGAGIMTPEVLKACLVLAHGIDGVGARVAADKAAIRALDGKIQEAGPKLQKQAVAAVTDPKLRKTYATQVAEYNAWVDERRATVDRHNKAVREFSEMSGRFNGECNGRSYFPSDLAAVASDLPPGVQARLK